MSTQDTLSCAGLPHKTFFDFQILALACLLVHFYSSVLIDKKMINSFGKLSAPSTNKNIIPAVQVQSKPAYSGSANTKVSSSSKEQEFELLRATLQLFMSTTSCALMRLEQKIEDTATAVEGLSNSSFEKEERAARPTWTLEQFESDMDKIELHLAHSFHKFEDIEQETK